MKVIMASILATVAFGLASTRPAPAAGEFADAKRGMPEMVIVRLKASPEGSVRDVEFLSSARGNVLLTPTGLSRHSAVRSLGQPAALDWEGILVDRLVQLRQDLSLGEQAAVGVAADDELDVSAAAAAAACCRRAGFRIVEFIANDPNKVLVAVGADGKLSVDGYTVTTEEIKSHLRERARAAGGPQRVLVVLRAHPQLKYAAVFRLLREFKESGYPNIEIEAQEP